MSLRRDRALPVGIQVGGMAAFVKRVENAIYIGVPLAGTLYAPFFFARHPVSCGEIVLFVASYALMGLGAGLGLHRHFAHRAFACGPALRLLLGTAGSLACQGSILRWVIDHRRHHAHTETVGDTHSPRVSAQGKVMGPLRGLLYAHVGWMFDATTTDLEVYGADLRADATIMFFHRTRWLWPVAALAIPYAVGYGAGGTEAALGSLLLGGCVPIAVLHHVVWAVNSVGHTIGSERFPQTNGSKNNLVLALLTFGDGWHNNHHRFPRSAFHGLARHELDLSGMLLTALERAGLVWNVVRVGEAQMRPAAGAEPRG